MPTALFLSPHLDDVVFSCGGTVALLADRSWRTVMVTAFTATVLPVTGFALACQLDKGLSQEVDYMALRREEDRQAAAILGVTDLRWLPLPEAPHRGYASAPALFAEILPDDDIWRVLARHLTGMLTELQPDLIFAPQGLGGHVDHRQLIHAVQEAAGASPVAWYRDTPYAIRNQNAQPLVASEPGGLVKIASTIERKIEASRNYASQIGFQFGGFDKVGLALREFARREGNGELAESFSGNLPTDIVQP